MIDDDGKFEVNKVRMVGHLGKNLWEPRMKPSLRYYLEYNDKIFPLESQRLDIQRCLETFIEHDSRIPAESKKTVCRSIFYIFKPMLEIKKKNGFFSQSKSINYDNIDPEREIKVVVDVLACLFIHACPDSLYFEFSDQAIKSFNRSRFTEKLATLSSNPDFIALQCLLREARYLILCSFGTISCRKAQYQFTTHTESKHYKRLHDLLGKVTDRFILDAEALLLKEFPSVNLQKISIEKLHKCKQRSSDTKTQKIPEKTVLRDIRLTRDSFEKEINKAIKYLEKAIKSVNSILKHQPGLLPNMGELELTAKILKIILTLLPSAFP